MNERAISLRTHSHAEKIKILMMMLLVCFATYTELNIFPRHEAVSLNAKIFALMLKAEKSCLFKSASTA